MNILLFSSIYPAPVEYGIPNDTKVVHYYARQWKSAGHTIQVIYLHMIPIKRIAHKGNVLKAMGWEADYRLDGIDVHLVEYQLLYPRANYLSCIQAKNAEKRIEAFLLDKAFVPDKVFVHFPCTFKGIKCASNYTCPTMAVLHNIDVRLLKGDSSLFDEISAYKTIGGRNFSICHTASELLRCKAELVLSGIDEAFIPTLDFIEDKLSKPQNVIKMVYAGNLIKLKNVDILIQSLSRVKFDYICEIIGDGPEKEKLELLANDNSKIIFRGRVSREKTIEAMRDSDMFVMVSSPETFGLVYIEAMAQGCITVGSKNEGIDGVIKDGINGFLVEPQSVDALVERLGQIAGMKSERRRSIGLAAYSTAVNMTDHKMADKYLRCNI